MDNIIIFGASNLGKIAYDSLKNRLNIVAFCDNDKNKQGKYFNGVKVISINNVGNYEKCKIIIASQYHIYIVRQILGLGIKKFGVFEKNNNSYLVNYFDYNNIKSFHTIDNKITLIVNNTSGSNTGALYKYIKKNKYDIDIVKIDENHKNQNYYYDLYTSKIIIRTHEGPYLENKINIQLWHGFPLKGLSYMSKNENQDKEFNHKEWLKIDCITSYSQLYNDLIGSCYGVDIKSFFITGMPRNDMLFCSDGKSNLSKLLKRNIEKEKVIFYMPTFRESFYGEKNGDKKGYIFNFDDFNMEEFNKFCINENILFVTKMHPMEYKDIYFQSGKFSNLFFIEEEYSNYGLDFYEILNSCDLLITDYSSIYFDYLLLDRPIMFSIYDIEYYRENRGFILEPYDFWTPGPKFSNIKDLKKELLKSLTNLNYYSMERKTICNLVHKFRDSNSSERVMKILYKYINNINNN